MARRTDTGWRDTLLAARHERWGFHAPAAGMKLPMIEYDRGRAVGIVSYLPLGAQLPSGHEAAAAYRAFGRLRDASAMDELPFLTARYDVRDWSMEVFPHNGAAVRLMGLAAPRWVKLAEADFAELLYRMRGRQLPDLSAYGVAWNTDWLRTYGGDLPLAEGFERWPGEPMSVRRREYEPLASVPFGQRVPCLDVDFAVIDHEERVAMLVDYKAAGGRMPGKLDHPNLKALASMTCGGLSGVNVAAFVAEYAPQPSGWELRVHCLNKSARLLLAYALGAVGADTSVLASTVAGAEWVPLTETEWTDVLRCARDV